PTKTATPTPGKTTNWKTYTLTGYNGFEFKYPANYELYTGIKITNATFPIYNFAPVGGGVMVLVQTPDNKGYFSVSRNGVIANLNDCKKVVWPNDQTETLSSSETISGIKYYRGQYTGVAAGTMHKSKVFRAFGESGGDGCFELIESVSLPTSSAGSAVENEIFSQLDQILKTFKFVQASSQTATSKILALTSPKNGATYNQSKDIRIIGKTKPGYYIQVYANYPAKDLQCLTFNSMSNGGAGQADANGNFDFPIAYEGYKSGQNTLVVAALQNSRVETCFPANNVSDVIAYTYAGPAPNY
ncbi:MAG: hypothetical protein AAB488_02815, partial [Patescibacteria group bacterium]